ncbi:MAG: RNA-binding protein [Lactovum sp.]
MKKNSIYQHFLDSEKSFIDQVFDWISQAEQRKFYCSKFLNPREREIVKSIVRQQSLIYQQFPQNADYARVIIANKEDVILEEHFNVSLCEVIYSSKFGELEHRQVLGAFIHETGLERHELGDILIFGKRVQIYLNRSLLSYFQESIQKIGKISVKLREIPSSEVISNEEKIVSTIILVQTMRLDQIIATSLKISRTAAVNLIKSRRVRVNYAESLKNDFFIKINDLISIRGLGRIKIINELGFTKKDKIKVEIEKIINQKGR